MVNNNETKSKEIRFVDTDTMHIVGEMRQELGRIEGRSEGRNEGLRIGLAYGTIMGACAASMTMIVKAMLNH